MCVGPVFGQLLAARAAIWLDQLRPHATRPLQLVEAGAHHGWLAGDALGWIRQCRSELFEALEYHILEPSPTRQECQRAQLKEFLPCLRWHSSWDRLQQATGGVCGVIFSNELLDAQPIHRFAWDRAQGAWFEWRVGLGEEHFESIRSHAPVDKEFLRELAERVPSELQRVLPDGYVVEVSPMAEQWWETAARALRRGWLLTFDYGYDDETALMPGRTAGTLRGYRRHQAVSDVLANPGTQDLTAHVHFGRMRRAGEAAGLKTEFCGEQGRFLTQCVADILYSDQSLFHSDAARLRQFKTLIHPDHFGRSFRTLVQSRLGSGGSARN